jgi:hypothetical protein
MEFEQEEVPKDKKFMISTRENSVYRWNDGPHVIGALEVQSEPDFNPRDDLQNRSFPDREADFDKTQEVWDDMKLRDEFVAACEGIPKMTCCCGLIPDDDNTMKEVARVLTKGWIKSVNKRLAEREEKFKIDMYVWSWHNATGKAETNILLIRFLDRVPKQSPSTLRSRSLSPPPDFPDRSSLSKFPDQPSLSKFPDQSSLSKFPDQP